MKEWMDLLITINASSSKLQAVDNLKKEFDLCRIVLYKVNAADGFVY